MWRWDISTAGSPMPTQPWRNWPALRKSMLAILAFLICSTNFVPTFSMNRRSPSAEFCKPANPMNANSTLPIAMRLTDCASRWSWTNRVRLHVTRQTDDADSSPPQPLCLALVIKDLTLLKEYEQLKSDMISLMSHELRTPLTSINGFAELLTADDELPAQAKEFVTIIANESQRMSRMINTFLTVTKLQRKDRQEVLKIPLRLDEIVRETIASMQTVAKKRRIRLVEQPTQRLPPVLPTRA